MFQVARVMLSRQTQFHSVISAFFVLFISCGPQGWAQAPGAKTSAGDRQLAVKAIEVLNRHCHSCHGDRGSDEGGFNFATNPRRLIAAGKVVPGDVTASQLLQKIVKNQMPPQGAAMRPSAVEIDVLTSWIKAGAPSSGLEAERKFVAAGSRFQIIQSDLEEADEVERRFRRYLTMTHLFNAGWSDDELETTRLALAKLLNSLSWERTLARPKAIDPERTVYRIDLRDFGWSAATWDRIVDTNPFPFPITGDSSWGTIANLSECQVPIVRADWFIATASRPPLYHAILDLPETLADLEPRLRIKIRQNTEQGRAARAGFTVSGVSNNPRLIERHQTSDGACWISHDFASSTGRANFFKHPLDFQADGGEVIYSLPNGLQAYLLINGKQRRIDSAPTSIVKDPLQPAADVVNGLSCIRCHAGGIIPKQDEVRRAVLANPETYGNQTGSIKALHPDAERFEKLVEEDQERFQSALRKLGITRFSANGEPVFNTARRFRDALDLNQASSELDLLPDQLLSRIKESQTLQRTLAVLTTPGGMINRESFTDAFRPVLGELYHGPVGIKSREITGSISGDLTAPADDPTEIKLPEDFSIMRSGGGGRFFIFLLPNAQKLVIVDVAKREIVAKINVTDAAARFAAGRDYLMIVEPGQRRLSRWSLETFTRDKSVSLPGDGPVQIALMGCLSQGPLMLWSGGDARLWDVEKMQPMEVEGKFLGGENRWDFQMRVSMDGQIFTSWHNGIGPTSFAVARLAGSKSSVAGFGGGSHNGRWALPSADGRLFMTLVANFDLHSRDLKHLGKAPGVPLPCVDPRFLLMLEGSKDGKNTVAICTICDQQPIYRYQDIEHMMTSSMPGNWGNSGGEPRVSFIPSLNALVTIPDNKRVVVRYLNLSEALASESEPYLFVVSIPTSDASTKKQFSYQIDARSKTGGLQYKLEAGPAGMTVSSGGEVTWAPPAKSAGTTQDVIVQITDSNGKELLHSFHINVID